MSDSANSTIQFITGLASAILGLNAISYWIHKRQNDQIKELKEQKINEDIVKLLIQNLKLELRQELKDILQEYYLNRDQVEQRIEQSVNPVMDVLQEIHTVVVKGD